MYSLNFFLLDELTIAYPSLHDGQKEKFQLEVGIAKARLGV